jgi:hypothetical protein
MHAAEISEQTEFLNAKTIIHQNKTTRGTRGSRAHITKTTMFVLSHSQLEARTESCTHCNNDIIENSLTTFQ